MNIEVVSKQAKYIKALAKRIEDLRQSRQWSYQDMANNCEIDKAQAHKICTLGVDVRISSLSKIADGFGITVSELLDF